MTNSCSIFVDVDLIWDTYVADDVVYEDADLIVQMDSFTKDYTGDTVKLDYKRQVLVLRLRVRLWFMDCRLKNKTCFQLTTEVKKWVNMFR